MKQRKHFGIPLFVLMALALLAAPLAVLAQDGLNPYTEIAIAAVPSGFIFPGGGFDISWVDPTTGFYYVADRGNSTARTPVPPGVDVLSVDPPLFRYYIPLASSGGTNGVLVFHTSAGDDAGTLVVGGNDSNTYFIDLSLPFAVPIAVSTGGNARADELAYDPQDQVILIANPDETAPNSRFVSFISTVTHTVLGKIIYDGNAGDGPAATGIEQPVWDGSTGKFYVAIPATTASAVGPARPNGEVDEIDPTTMTITRSFPTTCGPAGLVLIPSQRLMTSCGDVLDIASGGVVTTVTGIGPADEIWYNPGDQRVYFGGIVQTPVVNAVPTAAPPFYSVIATLPWTGNFAIPVPPPPAEQFSHSVAADSVSNRVFVPVSNVGVLVFTQLTGTAGDGTQ